MKEESEKLEAGLEEIKVESRSAFEFLKSNFAEFMRLQVIAEQDDKETVEKETSEVPRPVSLEEEEAEEREEEQSAETDTWSSTFLAPMQEDEEFRSTLSAVKEFESDSEDLPSNPLACAKSPILELRNVVLEDSDEENDVRELITEIKEDVNPLDKYDGEHAICTFFSTPTGHALIKLAIKLPDVTVSTRNALDGRTLKELFFDCQCKNKLKSFLEMFFETFSKDYSQPDFYMRFFQAIFLSDFYDFVREYSNSQVYHWHLTLHMRFPLDFFPQIFEMTHMNNLFNYRGVCKMLDELKNDILCGKEFFCFIQRTPDECIDYIRSLKNENINSEDVSHDSSYMKITSDE